jgi:hypothetical protein
MISSRPLGNPGELKSSLKMELQKYQIQSKKILTSRLTQPLLMLKMRLQKKNMSVSIADMLPQIALAT